MIAEWRDGYAAPVLLEVHVPLALDLHPEELGDGVHGAHAHPVKPRRDLVARVVELAAGVEDGHDDFGCANVAPELLRHLDVMPRRDSAPVVLDGNRTVEMDRDVHPRTVAAQMLVDGVVYRFPDEMVEA